MRLGLRSAALGILSPVAAAALAMGTISPAGAVSDPSEIPPPIPNCSIESTCKALILGGTLTGTLDDAAMSSILSGYFANDNIFTRQNVRYPGSVDFLPSIGIGSILLYGAIDAAMRANPDEQIVVAGFSQGAAVADQVMYRLLLENNVPDPDKLRFVLVGDPSRSPNSPKFLAPDVPYHITVINAEYDGFSDYPDRWWNGLAAMNATLGIFYLHIPSLNSANLDDVPLENITVTYNSLGGSVTHHLIPTERLPLVRFMRFLAPYEDTLRAIVDRGYSRNDDKSPQSALRTVSRQLEEPAEVADDAPQQDADEQVQDSAGAQTPKPEPESTEQAESTEQELSEQPAAETSEPAAEQPAAVVSEDGSDDTPAAEAGDSDSAPTGAHRIKRGSERSSVASIKNRLAQEAKAEAQSESKVTTDNDSSAKTTTQRAGDTNDSSTGSSQSNDSGGSERRGSDAA